MNRLPWTPEEDEVVRQNYLTYNWALLQKLLPNRTVTAIKGRAGQLGQRASKDPDWSGPDEEFLRQYFHTKPFSWIASELGRTEVAVELKAKPMGLRRRHRTTLTPCQIGKMMHTCAKRVKAWIRRGWLRASRAPVEQKRIHLVEPDDLVAFLRKHPSQWDARRCPDLHVKLGLTQKRGEAALSDRPVWLKEKLAADLRRGRRAARWTPDEELTLARCLRRGINYVSIGRLIGRSPGAIRHQVWRNGPRIWRRLRQTG